MRAMVAETICGEYSMARINRGQTGSLGYALIIPQEVDIGLRHDRSECLEAKRYPTWR